VQSNTGNLFSIEVKKGGTAREIHQIAADPVVGGDGMLLDRGRLIVVRGSPAALLFLKLKHHASSAKLVATQTDPTLRGPSTVARARHLYLVVNADFATTTTPFTVSGLPAAESTSERERGRRLPAALLPSTSSAGRARFATPDPARSKAAPPMPSSRTPTRRTPSSIVDVDADRGGVRMLGRVRQRLRDDVVRRYLHGHRGS
jgi:hypothetical protein